MELTVILLFTCCLCRVVKMTSPNLNYLIVVGALMVLIGNLFFPVPSQEIGLIAIFCVVSQSNVLEISLACYNNYVVVIQDVSQYRV